MDQNSSNDTDKRNWRERLGIGNKDMPRLSNEFTKTPETVAADVSPVRPAQTVAKPAPMAPRVPCQAWRCACRGAASAAGHATGRLAAAS